MVMGIKKKQSRIANDSAILLELFGYNFYIAAWQFIGGCR